MELRFNDVNITNMTLTTYSFLQNATYYNTMVEAESSSDISMTNSDGTTYTNSYDVSA